MLILNYFFVNLDLGMDMVFIHGPMDANMKVNIVMIKSMVLAFIFGLMVEDMKGIGSMENSMEQDNLFRMEKQKQVFGSKEKE